jgi:hypothetical protein
MKIGKLADMTPYAMGIVILLSLLAIGINLYVLLHQQPEPVRQSPLSQGAQEAPRGGDGNPLTPTLSHQGRGGRPCIFDEGIAGCRYNDGLGRKEGATAYKWYDGTAIMWKEAR